MATPHIWVHKSGKKQDEHLRQVEFRANKRPSSNKTPETYDGINWDKQISKVSGTQQGGAHIFDFEEAVWLRQGSLP